MSDSYVINNTVVNKSPKLKMHPNMTMASRIRKVEGSAKINWVVNGYGNDVVVSDTSRQDDVLQVYQDQIFDYDLVFDKKFFIIGETVLPTQAELDIDQSLAYYAIDNESIVGWIGDTLSDDDCSYATEQFVQISFENEERDVVTMVIVGDRLRAEYPVQFELTFISSDSTEVKTISVDIDNITQAGYLDKSKSEWNIPVGLTGIISARLKIIKWNTKNAVAKIVHFCSNSTEEFNGAKLQSIDILEDKTSSIYELSYDISCNSCDIKFLNENKKYYEDKNYALLRKNRRIETFLSCGNYTYSLGKFYSDEWQISDDSQFVTCRAYDILYGLQNVELNYGMIQGTGRGLPITPYKDQTVNEVIDRVFALINDKRLQAGNFVKIAYDTSRLSENLRSTVIPYVLLSKKTAWEILQDIANFCCCYVFADRQGTVIFQEDDLQISSKRTILRDSGVEINPSNAFRYNLPVGNRMMVNSVSVDSVVLTEWIDTGDNVDDHVVKVKVTDLVVDETDSSVAYVTIAPKLLYDNIVDIEVQGVYDIYEFVDVTEVIYNQVEIKINLLQSSNLEDFSIKMVYYGTCYNINKQTDKYQVRDSIKVNGLQEYKTSSELLLSSGFDLERKQTSYQKEIAERILNKYKNGIEYVDTTWTGNCDLLLGETFKSKSLYDKRGTVEIYECLSNDMTIGDGFRMTTKGRYVNDSS